MHRRSTFSRCRESGGRNAPVSHPTLVSKAPCSSKQAGHSPSNPLNCRVARIEGNVSLSLNQFPSRSIVVPDHMGHDLLLTGSRRLYLFDTLAVANSWARFNCSSTPRRSLAVLVGTTYSGMVPRRLLSAPETAFQYFGLLGNLLIRKP